MAQSLRCWNCGEPQDDIPLPISRHANCAKCYEVLHCCRMCIHLDPVKQGQCDHDRADPPVNKENANFCEYFKPARNAFKPGSVDRKDSAITKLDSLFGDADGEQPDAASPQADQDGRSELDDLFKD